MIIKIIINNNYYYLFKIYHLEGHDGDGGVNDVETYHLDVAGLPVPLDGVEGNVNRDVEDKDRLNSPFEYILKQQNSQRVLQLVNPVLEKHVELGDQFVGDGLIVESEEHQVQGNEEKLDEEEEKVVMYQGTCQIEVK